MMQFVVVMMIIGLITSYLFGTDTALKVGLKVMDWWILAGLAIVLLTPVLNIGEFILFLILKIVRLCRRKKTRACPQSVLRG